ncbi:MAG: acyl carrier protein [bacterium]|nr:acyl carrier protein [bacterium]
MNGNIKKLHSILMRVLEVDEVTITDEMSPDTVETWDSYNGLMLVSELETVFDVHFTMDEVVAVKNVKDIKDALQRHDVEI